MTRKIFKGGLGGYAMKITGTLVRLPRKIFGGYAMVITGNLVAGLKLFQTVGGYVMNFAGTLVTDYIPYVGGHIKGALKKIFRYYY